ncbi:MAG: DUF3604 domain-containing protein [Gammaproteobacteria bacterium]|jgi:hypothetical protein|nr:DUF3604 domain-containing protein [Gammaproteobacteria bacterium]
MSFLKQLTLISIIASLTLLPGCSDSLSDLDFQKDSERTLGGDIRRENTVLEMEDDILTLRDALNPERNAYFGDLHVHTTYSFDAFSFGTLATPYDAYRYAKGQAIEHPGGYQLQLGQPLDFYAVTDHAMFLGVAREAADTTSVFSKYDAAKPIHNLNDKDNYGELSLIQRGRAFATFIRNIVSGVQSGGIDKDLLNNITKSAWRDIINAADEANVPGKFTAFVAYEYTTSSNDRGNLHRNVIFRDSDHLPAMPFSRLNSQNPEGLWDWMDNLRGQGIESLAIPHNSNGSNGQMFKLVDWAGNPLDDDYTQQRLRNEPLVEITQVKGTSDTHPLLSENDEWADFEISPFRVATKMYSEPAGGYVRDAYLRGLKLAADGTNNPFKFGLIGSTDTHVAAGSDKEVSFFSKAGIIDGTAERRGSIPTNMTRAAIYDWIAPGMITNIEGRDYITFSSFEYWGASGLAAVWAEENTREAIYDAFRRKETFATTGPRMEIRFFAGYEFDESLLADSGLITIAYKTGVPMGADIGADESKIPQFLIWATRDANSAALQRMQIIKGYEENGETYEQIYDVACSDGLEVDPETHRCPDNGAKVNLTDCSVSADVGATQLRTLWQDPNFEVNREAFYYVRVLENPTCRWSTWDALKAGVEPRPDLPKTIQERAWSSPIWYRAK